MGKSAQPLRKGEDLYSAAEKNLLLYQKEIAAVLGVCPETIQNYGKQGMPVIYAGKVKGGKGSHPRYRFKDCEAWLESRQ